MLMLISSRVLLLKLKAFGDQILIRLLADCGIAHRVQLGKATRQTALPRPSCGVLSHMDRVELHVYVSDFHFFALICKCFIDACLCVLTTDWRRWSQSVA